jgi:hypothetical protein
LMLVANRRCSMQRADAAKHNDAVTVAGNA